MTYFERLKGISDPEPPKLSIKPKRSLSGLRAPIVFIMTEDHDGQVELSLSKKGLIRPTDAHVRAFFRWLEVEPLQEDPTAIRHTRHFILPAIVQH